MKREFDKVRSEIADTRAIGRRTAAALMRLEARFDDMDDRIDGLATKEDIAKHMDGFAKKLDEFLLRWAVHADTLSRHDKRLSKLEAKRA